MTTPEPPAGPPRPGPVAVAALYTLARLGLLALVVALLALAGVPFVLALLVGLVVALPLSMVAFRGLRARLDAALAEVAQRRSAERAALRARLRGDEPGPVASGERAPDDGPQRETDPGGR